MEEFTSKPIYKRFNKKNEPHATMQITDMEQKIIELIGTGIESEELSSILNIDKQKLFNIIEKLLCKTNSRNLAHLMMFAAINNI